MSQTLNDLISWMRARPGEERNRPAADITASAPEAMLTGRDLVDRIVQAIALDQSVLLTGPRGCGKSRSISDAIELAAKMEILPEHSRVFLQGNREIPRDYLAEDEIAFKTSSPAGRLEVIPDLRSAPLFTFAKRDGATRQLILKQGNSTKNIHEVEWNLPTANGTPGRFVLFLDEINRFSDGVLDSLLSVLEERTAVLGGQEYRVPAVVCMTMNPPGYDGSARRLSPPLAARIGRSFRMSTPDLDTLSDVILPDRLERARSLHAATSGKYMTFPEVAPHLHRRAALITLCMWGDFTAKTQGAEYLTPSTHELLRWAAGADSQVRRAMRDIGELCQFGPDGRALGDWTVAAIGAAKQEASVSGNRSPRVEERHYLDTVIESVAHKIYDNFSPASRPDLTLMKEAAIQRLAFRIMTLRAFERRVLREVDEPGFWPTPANAATPVTKPAYSWRDVFLRHGVTDPDAAKNLLTSLRSVEAYAQDYAPKTSKSTADIAGILINGGVAERSPEGTGCVFTKPAFQRIANDSILRTQAGVSLLKLSDDWQSYLKDTFREWSLERNALSRELRTIEPFTEYISISAFLKTCDNEKLDGGKRRLLASIIENLWNLNVDTSQNLIQATGRGKTFIAKFAGQNPDCEKALLETLERLYADLESRTKVTEERPGLFVRILQIVSPEKDDPLMESLRFQTDLLGELLGKAKTLVL